MAGRSMARLARVGQRFSSLPAVHLLSELLPAQQLLLLNRPVVPGPWPAQLTNLTQLHQQRLCYGVAARQVQAELDTYRITVVTGNVRGAGTGSTAWIQLIGTSGNSEKFVVGNSHHEGLSRASSVTFDIAAPKDIGEIKRVYVEREKASFGDTGDGWFLDEVQVRTPEGRDYYFPCHSWLGPSDCGDYIGETSHIGMLMVGCAA